MWPYDLKIGAPVGETEMEALPGEWSGSRSPAEVQRAGWPWGVSRRSTQVAVRSDSWLCGS
jgi:hypothetical protein